MNYAFDGKMFQPIMSKATNRRSACKHVLRLAFLQFWTDKARYGYIYALMPFRRWGTTYSPFRQQKQQSFGAKVGAPSSETNMEPVPSTVPKFEWHAALWGVLESCEPASFFCFIASPSDQIRFRDERWLLRFFFLPATMPQVAFFRSKRRCTLNANHKTSCPIDCWRRPSIEIFGCSLDFTEGHRRTHKVLRKAAVRA